MSRKAEFVLQISGICPISNVGICPTPIWNLSYKLTKTGICPTPIFEFILQTNKDWNCPTPILEIVLQSNYSQGRLL